MFWLEFTSRRVLRSNWRVLALWACEAAIVGFHFGRAVADTPALMASANMTDLDRTLGEDARGPPRRSSTRRPRSRASVAHAPQFVLALSRGVLAADRRCRARPLWTRVGLPDRRGVPRRRPRGAARTGQEATACAGCPQRDVRAGYEHGGQVPRRTRSLLALPAGPFPRRLGAVFGYGEDTTGNDTDVVRHLRTVCTRTCKPARRRHPPRIAETAALADPPGFATGEPALTGLRRRVHATPSREACASPRFCAARPASAREAPSRRRARAVGAPTAVRGRIMAAARVRRAGAPGAARAPTFRADAEGRRGCGAPPALCDEGCGQGQRAAAFDTARRTGRTRVR